MTKIEFVRKSVFDLEIDDAALTQLQIMVQSFIFGKADLSLTNKEGFTVCDIILNVS